MIIILIVFHLKHVHALVHVLYYSLLHIYFQTCLIFILCVFASYRLDQLSSLHISFRLLIH